MASLESRIANKIKNAAKGAYKSLGKESMSVGDYGDIMRHLGDGDYEKARRELAKLSPKQRKHLHL